MGSTVGDLYTRWGSAYITRDVSGVTSLTPDLGVGGVPLMGQTSVDDRVTSTGGGDGSDGDVSWDTDEWGTTSVTIDGQSGRGTGILTGSTNTSSQVLTDEVVLWVELGISVTDGTGGSVGTNSTIATTLLAGWGSGGGGGVEVVSWGTSGGDVGSGTSGSITSTGNTSTVNQEVTRGTGSTGGSAGTSSTAGQGSGTSGTDTTVQVVTCETGSTGLGGGTGGQRTDGTLGISTGSTDTELKERSSVTLRTDLRTSLTIDTVDGTEGVRVGGGSDGGGHIKLDVRLVTVGTGDTIGGIGSDEDVSLIHTSGTGGEVGGGTGTTSSKTCSTSFAVDPLNLGVDSLSESSLEIGNGGGDTEVSRTGGGLSTWCGRGLWVGSLLGVDGHEDHDCKSQDGELVHLQKSN